MQKQNRASFEAGAISFRSSGRLATRTGGPSLSKPCYAMLQRNLLYTGLTRGKKLVVLVGQKKAVAIAVRNVSGRRRWSKLSEWLNPRRPSAGVP
jgi:hypothetical protein